MREALLHRDPSLVDRIVVLNNFDLPDYAEAAAESPVPLREDVVTVAFTGNLGRFQGLETIVDTVLSDHPGAARRPSGPDGGGGRQGGPRRASPFRCRDEARDACC